MAASMQNTIFKKLNKHFIGFYRYGQNWRLISCSTHENHSTAKLCSSFEGIQHNGCAERIALSLNLNTVSPKPPQPNLTLHVDRCNFGLGVHPVNHNGFHSISRYSKQEGNHKFNRLNGHFFALLISASFFSFKNSDEEKEDEVIYLLKRARLCQYKREFSQAGGFYHKVLDVIADRGSSGEWDEKQVMEARVHTYDAMANMYLAILQLDKAENLYKETMKGLIQMGQEKTSNAMVEISLKLAMIYAMQKRNTDAEEGYKFCVETQEKKIQNMGKENPDENSLALLGMCVNSYSRFLIVQHKYEEAISNLKKALEIAKTVFGETNSQVAVLCNDIATIMSRTGNHKEAKVYADQAIKVATECESPDLPTYYCNFGVICSEMGEFAEARQYCKEALGLAKKYKDEECEAEAIKCLQNAGKKMKEEVVNSKKQLKEKQNK